MNKIYFEFLRVLFEVFSLEICFWMVIDALLDVHMVAQDAVEKAKQEGDEGRVSFLRQYSKLHPIFGGFGAC